MENEDSKFWWDELPSQARGDLIVADIGPGAKNVAVGKNITQQVFEVVGEPTPEDLTVIEDEMRGLLTVIENLRGQLDDNLVEMATDQAQLLKGELTKTGEEEQPSASTITQVGDWLLDYVPDILEVITGIFATPAVGRVVGKAGNVAVDWVRLRFASAPAG